jgi:hypothetical protein
MPATRRVNRHSKRDRLPSAAALISAREAIIGWWDDAWRTNAALRDRFDREVTAALPVPSDPARRENDPDSAAYPAFSRP